MGFKVTLDWWNWMFGVGLVRNIPIASEEYLCDHYEQGLMLRVGPLYIAYWFFQKAA